MSRSPLSRPALLINIHGKCKAQTLIYKSIPMPTIDDFVPVKYYLPGWPADIIGYPEQLDAVGISSISFEANSLSRVNASGTIQILKEIVFDLPLIPGLSLFLLNQNDI